MTTAATATNGIAGSSSSKNVNEHVVTSGVTSGLTINLHPLPILNISDHYNRSRFTSPDSPRLIGALLGTQSNREVSIVNSFELIYGESSDEGDVAMGEGSVPARLKLNAEFLENRKDQFRQVFPTLDVIGWYSVGFQPTGEDIILHGQFVTSLDTPIFLLFDPTPSPGSQTLPIKVYEAALAEGGKESESEGKFVELEYGIETGEAERIAVDGVSTGAMAGGGEDTSVVGNLTTQRNAIRMLYERIGVLLKYVTAVINKTAAPDHTILRQISSLVSTLPTMDAREFQYELMTEYSDVQLTAYLTNLTKQLSALSEYADKHNVLYPTQSEDGGGGTGGRGGRRSLGGMDFGASRRRK